MLIVQLLDPVYSKKDGILTYNAKVLDDCSTTMLAYYNPMKDQSIPEGFGSVTIYIDSTEVKINYVNHSENTDNPTIFVFTK